MRQKKIGYTERGSKFGNFARRLRQIFSWSERPLCVHKARVKEEICLQSRRSKKPNFESRAVYCYLLLEFIIALFLLTLCIIPFIGIPFNTSAQDILSIKRLQFQHLSDITVAQVKERIYSGEISGKELCHKKDKKLLLIEDEVVLPIRGSAEEKFHRKCFLYSSGKQGPNQQEYRLVTIEVVFKHPKRASFFINKKKCQFKFTYKVLLSISSQKTIDSAKIDQ